jgi:hypothetical protein
MQKDTHEVIPDASSALLGAWWSILKQNCYRRWDLCLPLHPREQGWIDDLKASSLSSQKEVQDMQSSGNMMATVFWDVHGVLLVDFTPPGSPINATAYKETLKRLKEAIRCKRPGLLTKGLGLLLLHNNARRHSAAATVNLSGAGKFFRIHHTVLIWHCLTSIYSQRWKGTSEVSASTPMKMFKIKSRNGYMPRTIFFSMKDLTNWYIAMITLQTDLVTMWEVKLIWDCISASWVTLYVVVLFK